jgi:hypothetical protein
MNKPDLGRHRKNRILVSEEEILHEIENQPRTSKVLGILKITWEFLSLRVQNTVQKIRQNRGILNRVRLSWTRRAFLDISFYTFIYNYSPLTSTLFLSLCCFLNKLQALYKFYRKLMMKLKKL